MYRRSRGNILPDPPAIAICTILSFLSQVWDDLIRQSLLEEKKEKERETE